MAISKFSAGISVCDRNFPTVLKPLPQKQNLDAKINKGNFFHKNVIFFAFCVAVRGMWLIICFKMAWEIPCVTRMTKCDAGIQILKSCYLTWLYFVRYY